MVTVLSSRTLQTAALAASACVNRDKHKKISNDSAAKNGLQYQLIQPQGRKSGRAAVLPAQ